MNNFLLRLKSILNGIDFIDDNFKSIEIIDKVKTKPEEKVICFDPPPFNNFFDQRD